MKQVTSELIDATYDAIELMSLLTQRLSDGVVQPREASSMSWLLGRAKERLEPVINALEELEYEQQNGGPRNADTDLIELGSEILSLHEKFSRRRRGEKA